MHTVALAVTDGVPVFEVAAACEVFDRERPDLVDPWYDFRVCAPAGTRFGGWFDVATTHGLDELARADTVIVPASRDVHQPPPADLVEAVRAAYDRGARIASACSGAFVLAAAGLLDGRRATTHWMWADLLAATYPDVEVDADVLYIEEGRILTSAGTAAALDLCLHLVRSDHGSTVANELARRLVVPPHRAGGQAQFISTPVTSCGDDSVADAMAWALARLDQPITVTDLAREAGVSPRTLVRRFHDSVGTTPLQWLHAQRVRRAEELLESTDDSVEQVAARSGMGTAATLRRHFSRAAGVPPETYRRTFRLGAPGESAGDRARR
jgi:AraC family transcriptional activator FtrA